MNKWPNKAWADPGFWIGGGHVLTSGRSVVDMWPKTLYSDKTRNRQACRDDYVHNVHTAGLHTSDRLLLEAVREVNLFDH